MSWNRRVSWLESSWCQKLIEHIKIFLYPKFERKRIYKERYVEALWSFNKVVWSVLAAMLEGILSQVFSIAKRNTVVVRHFLFFMNISQKIYLPSQLWSEPILLPGLTRQALTNAPINVKPQGGGRPGVGGGFDVTSLPVTGTFDHSSSPGVGTFDFNR